MLKIVKTRNIRFVGNLILSTRCEFCYDDVIDKYQIKQRCQWNCPIMNSVLLGLFCGQKRLNANQIHFEMHPVCGDKCFTMRTVHVRGKEMLDGQKINVPRCNQSLVSGFDISQNRSLHRAFRSLLTNETNVWTNLDNKLKNEAIMFTV